MKTNCKCLEILQNIFKKRILIYDYKIMHSNIINVN